MTYERSLIERLLYKEYLVIITGLVLIVLLAWWFIISGAGTGMSALEMTTLSFPPPALMGEHHSDKPALYWIIMLLMWWVMMIAMMVPSASPVILLYARVARHNSVKSGTDLQVVETGSFTVGYLLAWLLFSIAAVLFQWTLDKLGIFNSMMMWSTNESLSAALLVMAGIYQLSPMKSSCLRHCRAPAEFISSHWANGVKGACRMGFTHGLYCIGCCWFLMALLFVGGVMNLIWIAGLSILVLIEKLLPAGFWVARISGLFLIFVGYLILSGFSFYALF